MKKMILPVLAIMLSVGAKAQSYNSLCQKIEGETSFVFAGAEHWTFGVRQAFSYKLRPDLSIGMGSGFITNLNPDGDNVDLVPLYATGRWYWKQKKWSPFVDMSAGYVFATRSSSDGGAYVAPMVGFNRQIKGRLSLDLGLGYLYQGCTYMGENFNQHSPEIRIGLRY